MYNVCVYTCTCTCMYCVTTYILVLATVHTCKSYYKKSTKSINFCIYFKRNYM